MTFSIAEQSQEGVVGDKRLLHLSPYPRHPRAHTLSLSGRPGPVNDRIAGVLT